MVLIEFVSRLKNALHRGGIDEEIDRAFPSQTSAAKPAPTVSERVLASQQKFAGQYQNPQRKPAETVHPAAAKPADFGRFDPDFVSDKHLDDFDETKNIENFGRANAPQMPPPVHRDVLELERDVREKDSELRELATATPRRASAAGGVMERLVEELEDIRAQNGEILRRIQRIEEKMRQRV